jgi:hypothetical protein
MTHPDVSQKRSIRLRLDSQVVGQLTSTRSLGQGLGVEADSTITAPACCMPPTLANDLHNND